MVEVVEWEADEQQGGITGSERVNQTYQARIRAMYVYKSDRCLTYLLPSEENDV